jgi:hypothetical protein
MRFNTSSVVIEINYGEVEKIAALKDNTYLLLKISFRDILKKIGRTLFLNRALAVIF